jgi:hypothetical protein
MTFAVEKRIPKIWATSVKKRPNVNKQSPNRRKIAQSGHPAARASIHFFHFLMSCQCGNNYRRQHQSQQKGALIAEHKTECDIFYLIV